MNILKSILIAMLIVMMSLSIELEVNGPNEVILEKMLIQ
jgi:hypothetical protein